MMVHVMRTIEPTTAPAGDAPTSVDDVKDRIIANFRETMVALRCIGSERLVKLGVSMTQVHVLSMLQRHGDVPMSRLADLIDVSLSNATGLIDRMEERGYVERDRVPGRPARRDRPDDRPRSAPDGRHRAACARTRSERCSTASSPEQLAGIDAATADLRDAVNGEVDPTSRRL